jgi:hypothetical protein
MLPAMQAEDSRAAITIADLRAIATLQCLFSAILADPAAVANRWDKGVMTRPVPSTGHGAGWSG